MLKRILLILLFLFMIIIDNLKANSIDDYQLEKFFSISGNVYSSEGSSLNDVTVSVHSSKEKIYNLTKTDNEGFYIISDLVPSDDYIVTAFAEKYPVHYYENESSLLKAQAVNILNQDATNINFTLDRGAFIKGKIIFQGLESNYPRTAINVWSYSTQTGGDTIVNDDGSFIIVGLDKNISDYIIMANSKNYPTAYYSDNGDDNPENDTVYERFLVTGVTPSDLEHILTLSPGLEISGIVLTEKLLLQNIKIKTDSRQNFLSKLTRTSLKNEQYSFNFKGLPPGNYDVYVDDYKYVSDTQRVSIISNNITDLELNLKEVNKYEISGLIYNLSENEIVTIHAWSKSIEYGRKIRIKGMGKTLPYKLKNLFQAPDYIIEILSDNYTSQIYNQKKDLKSADIIDLSSGNISGINFTIDQSSNTNIISGTISFPQDAQAGEIVRVHAYSNKYKMSISKEFILGSINPVPYTLKGLVKSNDIIVSIWSNNYSHQFYNQQKKGSLATPVDTSDDNPDIINFILDKGLSISGKTINTNGNIVKNVRVSAFSKSTSSNSYAISDIDGNFHIMGLTPSDDFILLANKKNIGSFYYVNSLSSSRYFEKSSIIDLSSKSIENISIVLSEGFAISGNVQSTMGALLKNVRVEAWSDTIESGNATFTDEFGNFTINGLAQGYDYKITACPDESLLYQEQTKMLIRSGMSDILFMLINIEGNTKKRHILDKNLTKASQLISTKTETIDTVPPTNINVTIPEFVTDRNIVLLIGATGATDVYISNYNYEESGEWENISFKKEWKLTEGDGIKNIYFRFRDDAGNTSDYLATTTFKEHFENSCPIIPDMTFTISETLYNDLHIGTVKATDADNDPLTFTIKGGNNAEGFGIESISGLLFIKQSNIFPAEPGTYDLTISVEDKDDSSEAKISVVVESENYPPEIENQVFKIDENSSISTTVGVVNANDFDNDKLIFSIKDGNTQEFFTIDPDTGILYVNTDNSLDFEVKNSFILTIEVSDRKLSQTAQITINLNNINDNAPEIFNQSFDVQENTGINTKVYTLTAKDSDQLSSLNYNFLYTDNKLPFSLDPDTGIISVSSLIDYESQPDYTISVQVSDTKYTDTANLFIAILNTNDNPPVTEDHLVYMNENSPENTIACKILAKDADHDSLLFSFISDVQAFNINPISGEISVKESSLLDYETVKAYTIQTAITDGSFTSTQKTIIELLNENDNKPDLLIHAIQTNEDTSVETCFEWSDADSDSLSLVIHSQGQSGHISITSDNCISYSPFEDTYGIDTAILAAYDGIHFSNSEKLTITILPVNDPPLLKVKDYISILEDTRSEPINITVIDSDNKISDMDIDIQSSKPFLIICDKEHIDISQTSTGYILYLTPVADQHGNALINITVSDGTYSNSATFTCTVIEQNDKPVISDISPITMYEDKRSEEFIIDVSDIETHSSLLSLTAFSTNTDLIPNDINYLNLSGEGKHRKLVIMSLRDVYGALDLQLFLNDGSISVSKTCIVTILPVNDPPEIESVNNQFIEEDLSGYPTLLNVFDKETHVSQLKILIESDNTDLIPESSIFLHYNALDQKYSFTIKPLENAFGNSKVNITVSDGELSTSTSFEVYVFDVNDPPFISSIPDQIVEENVSIGPLPFTATDLETQYQDLLITLESSNEDLIPINDSQVLISNQMLTLTPVIYKSGEARITIIVNDGELKAQTDFMVSVISVNQPPEIGNIDDQLFDEDTSLPPIIVNIWDAEKQLKDLKVWVDAENISLFPKDSEYINVELSDNSYWIYLKSMKDKSGISIINVYADDGFTVSKKSFNVTVNSVEDMPVLIPPKNIVIQEDAPLQTIEFNAQDSETPSNELIISAVSDNINLLPQENISITGTSNQKWLNIATEPGHFGVVNIEITLSDSAGNKQTHKQKTTVLRGNTLYLNGKNDYVEIPGHESLNITLPFTVEAWIKPCTITTDKMIIINKTNADSSGFSLSLIPNNYIQFNALNENQLWQITSESIANLNEWTHIASSITEQEIIIYINGLKDVSQPGPISLNLNQPKPIILGGQSDKPTMSSYCGLMDDIRLWNILRSENDLKQFKNQRLNGNEAGLLGYWHFKNSNANDYCLNHSGHQNHGTIHKDAPIVSEIPDQVISEDTIFHIIEFTVFDTQTQLDDLVVSVKSTDDRLISNKQMQLSGTGETRYLELNPLQDKFGNCTIIVSVDDGEIVTSNSFDLTILPVNDPPKISMINNVKIFEDSSKSIEFQVTDVDTLLENMSFTLNTSNKQILPIENIDISISEQLLSFTPTTNQSGDIQFSVTISDGQYKDMAKIFVSITPVNDLPVISKIMSPKIFEDDPEHSIPFIINDLETSADQLNIFFDYYPENSQLFSKIYITGSGKEKFLNLIPEKNQSGILILTITVEDDQSSVFQSLVLTVYSVNDPPIIAPIEMLLLIEDTIPEPIRLSITDIETPLDQLDINILSNQHSVISPDDIQLDFANSIYSLSIKPKANIFGECNLCAIVSDSAGLSSTSCFDIKITPVNDSPEISKIKDQSIIEDFLSLSIPLKITDLETSPVDMLIELIIDENAINYKGYSLVDNFEYLFNFESIPNRYGSEKIELIVSDSEGLTASQIFTINVLSENDPPTIQDIEDKECNEDSFLNPIPIIIHDADDPKESLKIKVFLSNPSLSNYSELSNQSLTLSPQKNQHGSTDVTINVSDPGGLSSSVTFTWTVHPQNDPPIIEDIADIEIIEDHITKIPISITHVDFANNELTFNIISHDHNLLNPSEQNYEDSYLIITPEPDMSGETDLCLLVSDPNSLTAQSCFTVRINPINDLPVINVKKFYTINEDSFVKIPFTVKDVDSVIDTFLIESSIYPNFGKISKTEVITAENYLISFTPDINYNGSSYLTISVIDPNGGKIESNVEISVQPVNDIPLALSNKWELFEDSTYVGKLTAYDIEGDPLTYTINSLPKYGSFNLLDNQQVQYKPEKDFYGIDNFSFYVSDGLANSNTANITIITHNLPDTPVASAGSNLTVNELSTIILDASQSTDSDNDIIAYKWLQIDGVSANLFDSDKQQISFAAPDVIYDQDLTFELLVTDKTGGKSRDEVVVHVIDLSPPDPEFNATPTEGIVPLKVQFTDSTVGKVTNWLWDFGDGNISQDQNPVHTYLKSGKYTAILKASGPYGSKTKNNLILVHSPELKADFIATNTSGVAPLKVNFQNLSKGEIKLIKWDFGDNTQSNDFSPEHIYEMPGKYTVLLTIYGSQLMDQVEKPYIITVSDRKIKGRITSLEDSSQGIEGCFVIAYGNTFNISSFSDNNGNYTITGLPAEKDIKIGVFPPASNNNFLSQFYNKKDNLSEADSISTEEGDLKNIDINLKPIPLYQITGRIHDNNLGKENIQVSAFSQDINWNVKSLSDENGWYTLTGLKPASDYIIKAWWEEYNTLVYYGLPEGGIIGMDKPLFSYFDERLASPVVINNKDINNIDIVLSTQNNTIKGRVLNENSEGIESIWVNAWSESLETGNGALSDSDGHYTIVGLPFVSQSEAPHKGYLITIQYNRLYSYPDLVPVPSENIVFQIATTGSISGKILSENELPVSNACINIWMASDNDKNIFTSCTNHRGEYIIKNLPFASDLIVQVKTPGYPDHYFENTQDIENIKYIDLTGGSKTDVNFNLQPGSIISGQVYIESIEQKAGSGIWVTVWSKTGGISRQAQTDDSGLFKISALDSSITDYFITIQDPNYLPAFYCENAEGNTTTQMELATPVDTIGKLYNIVLKKGLSVCGKINGNFNLSKGVKLIAQSENFDIYQKIDIFSDKESEFCLNHLIPDYYTLTIVHKDVTLLTKTMHILSNINNLEFILDELPLGIISGIIHGLPENERCQIRIFSKSLQNEKTIRILGTGNPINYSIAELPRSNDYVAMVLSDTFPDYYYNQTYNLSNAENIDISNYDAENIIFHLHEKTAVIYGKIYFSEEYEGIVNISAWSESKETGIQKSIQIFGESEIEYSLTKLEKAPDYILKVEASGFASQYFDNASNPVFAKKIDIIDENTIENINFHLSKGSSISGKIVTDIPYSELSVEAESRNYNQIHNIKILIDGTYSLQGLKPDNKYYLCVSHKNGYKWYFGSNHSVINKNEAIEVYPTSDQLFNFEIYKNKSIIGKVLASSQKPIPEIWVQAEDSSGKFFGGIYTNDEGIYEILFLPDQSYNISVIPDLNSNYIQMKKENVFAGASSVNFILENHATASLSGTVVNKMLKSPESLASIIVTNEQKKVAQTVTDINGEYIINGLQKGGHYYIKIFPSLKSNSSYWSNTIDIIDNNQILNIELVSGINMHGIVVDKSNNLPINNVNIIVQSKNADYFNLVQSNEIGEFESNNMPDSDDYDLRLISDNHKTTHLVNQKPELINKIEMNPAGTVIGTVIHQQSGEGISQALVYIHSITQDIYQSTQTNENGEFKLKGLTIKDDKGHLISDYVLKVIAHQYPEKIIQNIQSGQELTILMSQLSENRFKIFINDINDDIWFVDLFKYNGDFVNTFVVKSNKWAYNTCLNSSIAYQLRLINSTETMQYWIGENKTLYENKEQAKSFFLPFEISINAPSQNEKRNIKNMANKNNSFVSAPELKSLSHPVYSQKNPFVSSISVVDMEWSVPGSENIVGYFVIFNNQANFEWDKLKISSYNHSSFTFLSSPGFYGKETKVYCHVAAIDDLGNLSSTSHAGPYMIDTVPPENIHIKVPETTDKLNIPVNIYAEDANEIYISTKGYNFGSIWQPYQQKVTIQLPSIIGKHFIYASFRDQAKNISQTHAQLRLNIAENTPPVADEKVYMLNEDEEFTGTLTGHDIDGDSLQFIIFSYPNHGPFNLLNSITGEFTYNPEKDFFGEDFFSFRVNDGVNNSDISICKLSVQNQNDVPEVYDFEFIVKENTSYTGKLQGNDIDQDVLTYAIHSDPEKGSIYLINTLTGEFQYIPDNNYHGTDSFLFTALDNEYKAQPAIVNINITPENPDEQEYPEGFIVDKNNFPLSNILITYHGTESKVYTCVTDENGHFIFETTQEPESEYPLKASGKYFIDIIMPWSEKHEPKTYTLLSAVDPDTTLLKGTCRSLNGIIDTIITARFGDETVTVNSVSGNYTIAVKKEDLPVDLEFRKEGYKTEIIKNLISGLDVFLYLDENGKQEDYYDDDDYDFGCFISNLK